METISVEPLELSLSPSEAARRLCHLPGFIYLDSANADGLTQPPHPHRPLSILGAHPAALHVGNLNLKDDADRLRSVLDQHRVASVDWGFPLGGLIGHVGYDGDFVFGEYEALLIYHHHQDQWLVVGQPGYLEELTSAHEPAGITQNQERNRDRDHSPMPFAFESEMSRERFIDGVTRAQAWIAAGDIYQVNLTHQFQSPRHPGHDPFAIYDRLRTISPAPYSAFLSLGNQHILSSSPECFLKMSGRGITTRPIKGTRPRFADPQLDEKSAYDLITSPKEVSELVMITDLERNDLGRICDYGSVHVSELLTLERFAQVFHLVSTVNGELRDQVDHLEALRLCSPGGSITGAPKKRAMEIIQTLEPGARGLYTGSIGYLGWNGESQFNIAIRTLIGEPDRWHFHVGAGIVADSDPVAEYEETLHKAAGIFMACEAASLAHPDHAGTP